MKREEVIWLRSVIENAVQSLDDQEALAAVPLYPAWDAETSYEAGARVRWKDGLWRCRQGHTALTGWEPENAAALWEKIQLTHSGTGEDPIPYAGNMVLEKDSYYVQRDVVYRCIRHTGNPVYHPLAELVGMYVEVVLNL